MDELAQMVESQARIYNIAGNTFVEQMLFTIADLLYAIDDYVKKGEKPSERSSERQQEKSDYEYLRSLLSE